MHQHHRGCRESVAAAVASAAVVIAEASGDVTDRTRASFDFSQRPVGDFCRRPHRPACTEARSFHATTAGDFVDMLPSNLSAIDHQRRSSNVVDVVVVKPWHRQKSPFFGEIGATYGGQASDCLHSVTRACHASVG